MIFNENLRKQSDKIVELIENAELSFEEDEELRSHFAKYVCVLCSGFLENVVHETYISYVKQQTMSVSIISYSSQALNKIQNPKAEKFREIAKSFCANWEPELRKFLEENERSAAINYIMTDRHKIAHGKDSDITLKRIKEYHLRTVEVVEFIEQQCGLILTTQH